MVSIVKTEHKEYARMMPKWKRARDAASGQDAVHAAGEVYLPKLADQTRADYEAYKNRALFYNATWRTISGLRGMIFNKPAKLEISGSVTPMLDDISLSGEPLEVFAMRVTDECLIVSRVGIYVDYPLVDTNAVTAADAMDLNLRPSMKQYCAESIINWKTRLINNKVSLSLVVIKESHYDPLNDFQDKETIQYRVLDLVNVDYNGSIKSAYRTRVFVVSDKDEDIQIQEDTYPRFNGEMLDYIPFYFISPSGTTEQMDEPCLIDLVDTNLSHYRTNADYEHGCHFTGLPTPIIAGYQPTDKSERFYIGSRTAWVFPNPNATATYLEFKGDGLGSLKDNLINKQQMMAIIGARMLEAQSKAVESADTAGINRSGEHSMLSNISKSVSMGIEKALVTFSAFAGSQVPVKYELNKDFFAVPMDALRLTALIAGWQNGAYNYETLFANLKRGEVVDVDQTIEQELAKMELHKPEIPAGTQVNQDNKPKHETTLAAPTQRQLQTPK